MAVGAGSKPALHHVRLVIPCGLGTRPYNTIFKETALELKYSSINMSTTDTGLFLIIRDIREPQY